MKKFAPLVVHEHNILFSGISSCGWLRIISVRFDVSCVAVMASRTFGYSSFYLTEASQIRFIYYEIGQQDTAC